MSKNIKAVLFDLDGVLVDTTRLHYDALNKALQPYGFYISEEHSHYYEGLPTASKLAILSDKEGLDKALHSEIALKKNDYYLAMFMKSHTVSKEHVRILEMLQSAGVKQAVCTNTTKYTTLQMLEKAKLIQYLDVVLTRQDIAQPKPHPEVYIQAMRRLGVKPGQTLILEDSDHGIKAAEESGAHVMIIKKFQEVTVDNIKSVLAQL